MARQSFKTFLRINNQMITQIVIDDHYELKHSKSISLDLIVELVELLDGQNFRAIDTKNDFSYFVNTLDFKNKKYKLVWLLEKHQLYVGVVNAYRRK